MSHQSPKDRRNWVWTLRLKDLMQHGPRPQLQPQASGRPWDALERTLSSRPIGGHALFHKGRPIHPLL